MATKSVNIRVNSDLKAETDAILDKIGLTTSAVVSMLFKAIVRNQSIPPELFTISDKAKNNAEYLSKLDRSFAEYQAGLGEKHPLLKVPHE